MASFQDHFDEVCRRFPCDLGLAFVAGSSRKLDLRQSMRRCPDERNRGLNDEQ